MSAYPSWALYEKLYARFVDEGKLAAFAEAVPFRGKRAADLCGGGGRLAALLLARGALSVDLVDESAPMLTGAVEAPGLRTVASRVEAYLAETEGLEAAYCVQAANYWLDEASAKAVFRALAPGGSFVFNTFNEPVPKEPTLKAYELGALAYKELSWTVAGEAGGFDMVWHVQTCEGLEPHVTCFRWLSPERLAQAAQAAGFDAEEIRRGASSTWIWRRPA